jgi:hypothetical protein
VPGDFDSNLLLRGGVRWEQVAPRARRTSGGAQIGKPKSGEPQIGESVGQWQLRELLGRGAFGTVYRATRSIVPGSSGMHEAAVKVLTREDPSGAVVARFGSERELLAKLSHPCIAQLIDAGHTASGMPWVAMGLVRGAPIDLACDRAQADVRTRVRLIALVCDAVAAAHRIGIVHRDLKPGNILVDWSDDRNPRPVIIDFGVAKSLDPSDRDAFATRDGAVVGTVEFISPEAAALGSSLLDTRSDVYSLGVIAAVVLGGALPIQMDRSESVNRMLQRVREEEPARLSAIAARSGKAQEWVAQVSGGLEWIVHRALEKDPDRRYESAASLAEDLRRWLDNLPVIAAPPSAIYPVMMWARRNRGIAVGIAVAAAGLVVSALWAGWVARERGIAAGEVRSALERERLLRADTQDRYERFRSQLTPVLERFGVGERLGDSLDLNASLLAVHEEVFGREAPSTSSLRRSYANALRRVGRPSEALPHHWMLVDMAERSLGPSHRSTLMVKSDLAQTMRDLSMGREMVELLEPVVAAHDAAGAQSDPNQYARGLLAWGYAISGSGDLATATVRDAAERIARGPLAGSLDEAIMRGFLADRIRGQDWDAAAQIYQEISAHGRYRFGSAPADQAWRAAWRGEWLAWMIGNAAADPAERECLRSELSDCLDTLRRNGTPVNERTTRFSRVLEES